MNAVARQEPIPLSGLTWCHSRACQGPQGMCYRPGPDPALSASWRSLPQSPGPGYLVCGRTIPFTLVCLSPSKLLKGHSLMLFITSLPRRSRRRRSLAARPCRQWGRPAPSALLTSPGAQARDLRGGSCGSPLKVIYPKVETRAHPLG